jgi:hypothetical protein
MVLLKFKIAFTFVSKTVHRRVINQIPVTAFLSTVSSVHLFQNLMKMSKEGGNLLDDSQLASIPPLCALESSEGKSETSK